MRLIARFKQLSPGERRLFLQAIILVAGIRCGLSLLPFRVMRKWVDCLRRSRTPSRALDRRKIEQIAWAVQAASRRIPMASCLTQGMATQILLGRQGQDSDLRLGVAQKPNGTLEAHAWVETQGRVVTGGGIERFERFTRLERQTSWTTKNSANF